MLQRNRDELLVPRLPPKAQSLARRVPGSGEVAKRDTVRRAVGMRSTDARYDRPSWHLERFAYGLKCLFGMAVGELQLRYVAQHGGGPRLVPQRPVNAQRLREELARRADIATQLD